MSESENLSDIASQNALATMQWLAPHEVRSRPDVQRNLREGQVHAKLTARSYDQSGVGFDGSALLDLIDRCRLEAERLRTQGPEADDETRHYWHIKLLDRLGAIEIGVTRLLGIPCEFGQYSLRNKTSAHPMFAPIRPLRGPYRSASESLPTPVEWLTPENGQGHQEAFSGP